MVKPENPQMTIWLICVACWIGKATSVQAHAHFVAQPHTYTRGRAQVFIHASTRTALHIEVCNTYYFSMATAVP